MLAPPFLARPEPLPRPVERECDYLPHARLECSLSSLAPSQIVVKTDQWPAEATIGTRGYVFAEQKVSLQRPRPHSLKRALRACLTTRTRVFGNRNPFTIPCNTLPNARTPRDYGHLAQQVLARRTTRGHPGHAQRKRQRCRALRIMLRIDLVSPAARRSTMAALRQSTKP